MNIRSIIPLLFLTLALMASISCVSSGRKQQKNTYDPRFFLEHAHPDSQRQDYRAVLPVSRSEIELLPFPAFDQEDLRNVDVVALPMGKALAFHFKPEASRHLMSTSATATGRRLVLSLGNRFVGARRFEGALTGGVFILFVELPDEELEPIARSINASIAKD